MSLDLLKNSLLVSGGTMVVAGALGLAVALWAVTLESRWRHLIVGLCVATFALPSFLQTNCWLELLGATGSWRSWLPMNIYSIPGTVWVMSLLTWPVFFFFALTAWSRIDAAQIESDPAMGGLALLRFLLLPVARTSVTLAAVLVFVLALNNFAVPALLQVKVFPAHVWIQFETKLDASAAFLTSIPLIVAPLFLLLLASKRELTWPAGSNVTARALRSQLGRPLLIVSGFAAVSVLLLSLLLPAWQLMSARRTWIEIGSAASAVSQVVQNSFIFAAAAALACVVGGIMTWRWRFGWVLWLPFFVPGVLLGIALIVLMNHPPLDVIYRSAAIIICAWTIRYVAIGWHTATAAFRTVDPDLIDAARICGASSWAIFRHVRLPQIAPKLVLGWYVVYLLCLWDVETLILILPPGGETLAVRIFGLLHYGHNTQVNALCLLLVALALAPLLAWRTFRFSRRILNRAPAALCLALFLATGCEQKTGTARMSSGLFRAVEVVGHRGAGAGEFNKPRSIALDRNDNLYVADMTGRVQKFSPDGKFLLSWQMPQTDLGKPKGMCLDRDGNIIVLEPHYQRVNHFSPDGKLIAQWGRRGTNRGEMMLPRSVAVNSRGDIFLPEYKDVERVQGFSAQDKQPIALIGKPGTAVGEFNRAEGIAIDSQDLIYVADSCNHRIQIFSPTGKWLRTYGRAGNNAGEMSYPYDIRVDRDGRQYVCEFGNSRVQIFDSYDQPIESLGGAGATPGQFNNPWSIALDSRGNLYVCDTGNHRVQKFIRK